MADAGAAVTHVLGMYHNENDISLKKGASTLMNSSESIMHARRKGSCHEESDDFHEKLIWILLLGLEHHQSTFEAHKDTLVSLQTEAGITMRGAGKRLESAKNDIKSVSDTVLKAVSRAGSMYHCVRTDANLYHSTLLRIPCLPNKLPWPNPIFQT